MKKNIKNTKEKEKRNKRKETIQKNIYKTQDSRNKKQGAAQGAAQEINPGDQKTNSFLKQIKTFQKLYPQGGC